MTTIDELQTKVDQLQERRRVLQARERELRGRAGELRHQRLRAMADGAETAKTAKLGTEIHDLDTEAAEIPKAIALLDEDLAKAERALLKVQAAAAEDAADRARGAVADSVAALDTHLRQVITTELLPLAAKVRAEERAARQAVDARDTLRERVDPTMHGGRRWSYNAPWGAYPDLLDVLETLERYVNDDLPGQRHAAIESHIRAADAARVAARAKRADDRVEALAVPDPVV